MKVCMNHLHTYTCLPYNSLISGWILIKFVSLIVLSIFYLWTNFQSEASFWMHLREASTPFIDYSHNMHSRHIICIKLQVHKLQRCINLQWKFKEIVTWDCFKTYHYCVPWTNTLIVHIIHLLVCNSLVDFDQTCTSNCPLSTPCESLYGSILAIYLKEAFW